MTYFVLLLNKNITNTNGQLFTILLGYKHTPQKLRVSNHNKNLGFFENLHNSLKIRYKN